MKKATFIKKEDLGNLATDENGNYLIPDGIVIYIDDTQERVEERIISLESEIEQMGEPSDAELIEEGRMMHPYYMLVQELEMLKNKEL